MLMLAGTSLLRAQEWYWDLNGTSPDTGAAIATGTWDAATANWNPLADGTGATAAWTPGSLAVFSAGADATGAYTVTVSGAQVTTGLRFEEGTVTLSGGTVALGVAAHEISVGGGLTTTIGSVLAGTAGFDKSGAGTLVVTAANTLSGASTISAGTLKYGNVTATGTYSFGLGSAVTIKSGAVLDFASLHATTVQTMTWNVAPVTLEDGATWRFRAQTGSNTHNVGTSLTTTGTTTIDNNGGAFAQDINLTGKISGTGTINYLASSGSGSTVTTRTLTVNNSSTDFSGNWFADYTGSTPDDFVALKSTAPGALGTGVVTLDDRAQLINGVANGLNSLAGVTLQKATSTLDAGSGWNNAAAALTLSGGTVRVGASASSFGNIAVGSVFQTGGSIALDANATGNDQLFVAGDYNAFGGSIDLSFASAAPANGSTYTLVTYGGSLFGAPLVNTPVMRPTASVNLGLGTNDKVTVSFSGSIGDLLWSGASNNQWDLNTSLNFTLGGTPEVFKTFDNVTFDDSAIFNLGVALTTTVLPGVVTFANSGNTYTLSGPGAIGGPAMLIKTGAGLVTISTVNTYTGATFIDGGTLQLGALNAIPGGAGKGSVTVNGTLDLNSFSDTLNGLSGSGLIDNTTGGTPTLTLGIDTNSTFSGTIRNTGGAVAVTKIGVGTLTLSGPNSYAGLTSVTAGTLRLVGPNSLSGGLTLNGATAVVRVDDLAQLPAGVLTLNNSGVLEANGTFTRAQGTGPGQVQSTAGMVGFSAVGGPLTLNFGGSGAAVTNAVNGFNSNGFLLNDAAATNSLTFVNPLTITVSNPYFFQLDATTAGVESILQGSVSSVNAVSKTGAGTLVLAGATNALNGGLSIGSIATGGTVRIASGANITSAAGVRLIVGYGANSTTVIGSGVFTMEAGAGTVTFGGNITGSANYLGVDGGAVVARTATGIANINGGTLALTGMASGAGYLYIGANSGFATGVLNINGGIVNVGTKVGLGAVSSATAGIMGTGSSSNTVSGTLNGSIVLNSGTLSVGTGTGTDADRGFVYLSNDGNITGQASVVLNGGTLSLNKFYVGNGVGTSAKTILFNGGTVQARASRADFLDAGVNAIYKVQAGSGSGAAVFDTNGNNITVGGALVHDSALGATPDGGLVKNGSGTLTLAGANTYTGPTLVNAGGVAVVGSLAGGLVSLADATILSGHGTIGGALTIGTSAGSSYFVDGTLNVNGNFAVNGNVGVTLNTGSFITPGAPIPILNYGTTLATPANFTLINSANFRSSNFTMTAHTLLLDVGAKSLTWTGAAGAVWDNAFTASWNDPGPAPSAFYTADTVTFDDTATAANATVALSGALAPAAVVANNSAAVNYVFNNGAGGSIAGGSPLLKKGNGILSLNLANTYTGGTTISQGTVQVNNATALGTGTVTLGDASTGGGDVALFLENYTDIANNVTVSALGTGTVTIGLHLSPTGTAPGAIAGVVTLNRPTIFFGQATDRLALNGKVTGNVGTLTIAGGSRTTFLSTANDFVGDIVITGTGTILQASVASAGETVPNGTSVQVDSGSIFQLAGSANAVETINALTGSGTVTRNVAGLQTLVLGANGGSGVFNGVISNGSGTVGLTKIGAGIETLGGNSAFTGATLVSAGTLLVDGSLSGSSAVTVNGGTLAGFGSVGAVTLTSGTLTSGDASLLPLTTGNLALNGGSILFELSPDGISDRISANGTIAFGANVQLKLAFAADLMDGTTFTLLSNDGNDAFGLTLGSLAVGGTAIAPATDFVYASGPFSEIFELSYTGGDGNDLTLMVVPEPGTSLALLGGLGVLLACRRRRA